MPDRVSDIAVRYRKVGRLSSLSGRGDGFPIHVCRDCGALIWDTKAHEGWHADG